ncbi:Protein preY, mitochondrial [Cricetulus griseus]|uniref:Protein preY, mitochondrial n=2 Tax=Cricetulus griseus TaxID=10029 RepID=G3HMR2_CRIGR|nr:Protein preY, mitochondrial [Cricetulus griseus]
MLSAACRRLGPALRGPRAPSAVAGRCLLAPGVRSFADQGGRAEEPRTFHPELLRCLVCPLSKKPLR